MEKQIPVNKGQKNAVKSRRFLRQAFCIILTSTFGLSLASIQESLAQGPVQDFDYWASLCSSQITAKKYEEAIAACDRILTINPNDAKAWANRGEALIALSRYPEAVAAYDQVLRLEPQNSLAATQQCYSLNQQGDYNNAIQACEKALEIDANWGNISPAMAWYNRAVAQSKLGKTSEGLESLEWAIRINPKYSLALAERCSLLSEMAQYDRAIASCNEALEGEGKLDNGIVAIVWKRLGQIYQILKYYDKALAAYDQALALNPKDDLTWTSQGFILEILGRHSEALVAYNWALKVNPNSSLTLTNKCATLNRLANFTEAQPLCEKALQEGDNKWGREGAAYGWAQLANSLTGLNRYEEALAASNRAIALNPNYADAWSNRATTLWYMGRNPEALAATERAIAINPDSSVAWFNQGRIFTTLDNLESAVAAYQRGLRGDANVGNLPTLADLWVNQSAVLYRLKRYPEAVVAAQQAVGIKPNSAEALYNLALAQMASKNYADAVTAYDRAIAIDAKNANYWAGKGIALQFLERYAEALPALEEALKLNPNHAQALVNRDLVQKKLQPPSVMPLP
ncbi:MAG: tetratricopeptide repeat protein [Phormidium sp.]